MGGLKGVTAPWAGHAWRDLEPPLLASRPAASRAAGAAETPPAPPPSPPTHPPPVPGGAPRGPRVSGRCRRGWTAVAGVGPDGAGLERSLPHQPLRTEPAGLAGPLVGPCFEGNPRPGSPGVSARRGHPLRPPSAEHRASVHGARPAEVLLGLSCMSVTSFPPSLGFCR